MPKYTYHCSKCNFSYTISHGMNEIHDICKSCGTSESLNKIPTSFNFSKKIERNQKVGALVNETIEESKKDIEETKEALKARKHEH
jgi:putative FmdB family regulatory protein